MQVCQRLALNDLVNDACAIGRRYVEDAPIKRFRDETVAEIHRHVNPAEPLQRARAQTLTHRIADDERADERCAADCGAQYDAEVRAPIKTQAAFDECAAGHRCTSWPF